jgi:hypothetical protein
LDGLKDVLQGELNLTFASRCGGDNAGVVSDAQTRRPEVGMVKCVEEFNPELELAAL